MNHRLFLLISLLAAIAVPFAGLGCGDDDDDDDDNDDTSDDDTDDDDTTDDDTTDDDTTDDDTGGETWTGEESVTIATPDGDVAVDLAGLPAFLWTDPEDATEKLAVLVRTVVDAAFTSKDFDPADYKFNFVASDGYDILAKKLDGDYRGLPSYDELQDGWFIEYEETEPTAHTDIKVIWDEALGYPAFMSARFMDGGEIGMVENVLYDQDVTVNVVYATKGFKAAVNLIGLPAFDDGGTLAVRLNHVVAEAALEGFDPKTIDYAFNFIANDDYNLLVDKLAGDTSLLPVWNDFDFSKDIHHGWLEDGGADGTKVVWDPVTEFPGFYGIKHLEDGTIEVWDVTK
jgi:hypothetical protein